MIDPADMAPNAAGLAQAWAVLRALGAHGVTPPQIATTPKSQVWRQGKTTLHRYHPLAGRGLGPVLVLHGLIGRQTVTDLQPDRSLVRRLLAAGVDIWVLDWGNATRADRFRDFADLVIDDLGGALDRIESATARRVAILGICQGGVLAACHAALHPGRLAGLALAVTPIDFHADGGGAIAAGLRALPPDLIDRVIAAEGVVPGQVMGAMFRNLTPVRSLTKYTDDLAALADDPEALATFLRMEIWLADRPDHPGAAARQWLVELYGQNRLVQGQFAIDGRPVRLGSIDCPVLSIVGTADHIVPPPQALALAAHLAPGQWQALHLPVGHAGVFVARRALAILPPALIAWLGGLT